jgi:two-component system phosphate regulon sensor histidine kinase PhoR
MLTPGGIHEKIAVMGAAANQLLFEKELADRALFTETHGVLLFGPDLRCLFANDRALIFGAANDLNMLSADAFVKALQPAIVDEDRDEIVREILAGTWRLQAFTVELPLPQKQFFTVDITLLDAGTERYTLFVFSDITKLKELEILKTHIASTVSHEIKTPMTSIQGFSELLAHNLDGKMKEYAEVINRQARSLVRFLDTFLDITRIEQGRQPFMMTTVRLQDVIAEVLTDLSPLAAGKQIQLHAALPDGDCLVRLDRDVIRQCLLNLTENAIKYSPQESAITVRLEDAPEQATIQVIDQGYGIAQDDLGRIFEKFYRASAPGFESIRGAGLGLTFVKEAIEAQGGFLTVQSTLGAGSTFTIIFPKAANSLTDEASFEKPAGE